jgi:purine-binding chemotaxis protein CheW
MDINTKTKEAEEQLVIFSLAGESYGVDIGTVNEIIRPQEITRVPRTPRFVKGVINLRGKVITVVDLRKVFDLPVGESTKETRIVVVDILGQQVGIMVDAVTEVLRIPADSVEPPSSMISSVDSDYLLGIAKLENRMITLLDLGKVLSHDQAMGLAAVDVAEAVGTSREAKKATKPDAVTPQKIGSTREMEMAIP